MLAVFEKAQLEPEAVMPDFGVPAVVPAPVDGMLLPVPGVRVPD